MPPARRRTCSRRLARHGAHAHRGAAGARQALRGAQPPQPRHARRAAAPGSGSSPPARTYHELLQALEDLGLGADALAACGILKVGMPFPLDEEAVREFADGLDEVLVVEEKRPFLERLVKDALYGARRTRRAIVGKRDEHGAPLCRRPACSTPTDRARASRRGCSGVTTAGGPGAARRARRDRAHGRARSLGAARTPFFCSGCPHNTQHPGAGRRARRRRHRLPHDGDAEPAGHGQVAGHHADGRRGRAVDRRGAVPRAPTTSSRTSATARSTTPARWRSARPSRPS